MPCPQADDIDPLDPTLSPVLAKLKRLWSEVLHLESVNEDTDFFDAGGDSLQLVRLVAKARSRGLKIPVQVFIDNPTPSRLSAALTSTNAAAVGAPQSLPDDVPLLPSQVRFLEWRVEDHNTYSTTIVATVDKPSRPPALKEILTQLAERHTALRTVFPGGPTGRRAKLVDARSAFWFRATSAAEVPADGRECFVADAVTEMERAIDLTRGPLWGCLFVDGIDGGGLLALTFHQLVADGPSVDILVEDFQDAYAASQGPGRGALADDPAARTATLRHARELEKLADDAGEDAVSRWLSRPWHRAGRLPRPGTGAADLRTSRRFRQVVGSDLTDRFLMSRQLVMATSEEVLISAVALAVGAVTHSGIVGLTVNRSGRTALNQAYELARAVGYLVLSTPYLLELPEPDPAHGLGELIDQIRACQELETAWGALRYLSKHRERLDRLAAPEVHLIYRGQPEDPWRPPFGGRWRRVNEPRAGQLPCPVSVYAEVVAGQLRLTWIYGSEVVGEHTVAQLAETTLRHLDGLLRGSAS